MKIQILRAGGSSVETTLDEFLLDNDTLHDDEIEKINETLARGETYFWGQGATPDFSIVPVAEEEAVPLKP